MSPLLSESSVSSKEWWDRSGRLKRWEFPNNQDDELALRFYLMRDVTRDEKQNFVNIAVSFQLWKTDKAKNWFLSIIARPFCEILGDKLEESVNIPSQEARDLQAVPLERIPAKSEIKIFLSHKTVDKPLVMHYYKALSELGFKPWLDEPEMPAGVNVDRSILKGFKESCAAVFFITENFQDEKFLADEINYAKIENRDKGNRFSIITLHFPGSSRVPDLLQQYTYKNVENDLDGLYEIIRALPIELGSIRWKEHIVK